MRSVPQIVYEHLCTLRVGDLVNSVQLSDKLKEATNHISSALNHLMLKGAVTPVGKVQLNSVRRSVLVHRWNGPLPDIRFNARFVPKTVAPDSSHDLLPPPPETTMTWERDIIEASSRPSSFSERLLDLALEVEGLKPLRDYSDTELRQELARRGAYLKE